MIVLPRPRSTSVGLYLLAAALSTNCASAAENPLADDPFQPARCDPAKVLGVDSCLKCHAKEIEQWKTTPHFATFDSLHRSAEAKAIARKLGLRSVKRNDTCLKCHYTSQEVDGRNRVVAGVSCESCHGGAKDWIEMHSDYGGPEATRESESPAHRAQRLQHSIEAGMNNPANLYLIARGCLACHTSPDEQLVNVGGHVPGSDAFELVAWSQGMIRHNFLQSGGTTNQAAGPARLRVMYVVGVLADLEASLRATALGTEKATFAVTAAKRAARQKKRLYEITQLVDNPHIQEALAAAMSAKLKLDNREALLAAAEGVGRAGFEFASTATGEDLAAVDPLLPAEADYKWTATRP
jgi:hypothetical protein